MKLVVDEWLQRGFDSCAIGYGMPCSGVVRLGRSRSGGVGWGWAWERKDHHHGKWKSEVRLLARGPMAQSGRDRFGWVRHGSVGRGGAWQGRERRNPRWCLRGSSPCARAIGVAWYGAEGLRRVRLRVAGRGTARRGHRKDAIGAMVNSAVRIRWRRPSLAWVSLGSVW